MSESLYHCPEGVILRSPCHNHHCSGLNCKHCKVVKLSMVSWQAYPDLVSSIDIQDLPNPVSKNTKISVALPPLSVITKVSRVLVRPLHRQRSLRVVTCRVTGNDVPQFQESLLQHCQASSQYKNWKSGVKEISLFCPSRNWKNVRDPTTTLRNTHHIFVQTRYQGNSSLGWYAYNLGYSIYFLDAMSYIQS